MREEQCAYWNRLESEVAMVWRMCRDPLGEDWSSSNPMEGREELRGRFSEALWDGRCYSHLTFLSNGPVLTQQLDGSCLKRLLLPPFPQGLSGHSAGGCSHYCLRPLSPSLFCSIHCRSPTWSFHLQQHLLPWLFILRKGRCEGVPGTF